MSGMTVITKMINLTSSKMQRDVSVIVIPVCKADCTFGGSLFI